MHEHAHTESKEKYKKRIFQRVYVCPGFEPGIARRVVQVAPLVHHCVVATFLCYS